MIVLSEVLNSSLARSTRARRRNWWGGHPVDLRNACEKYAVLSPAALLSKVGDAKILIDMPMNPFCNPAQLKGR